MFSKAVKIELSLKALKAFKTFELAREALN